MGKNEMGTVGSKIATELWSDMPDASVRAVVTSARREPMGKDSVRPDNVKCTRSESGNETI
jgi:hypothetical protein